MDLLIVAFLWGCAPRSAEAVDALAARAALDPKLDDKLVASLAVSDPAVWEHSYRVVIRDGDRLAPELRDAVALREVPLSGRAALVLGEIARPEDVAFLRGFARDRTLGVFAREGVVIAERVTLERLRADPTETRCESFLATFPGSEAFDEVAHALRERQAEGALADLGGVATHDQLAAWYRGWMGTDVAEATRPRLAEAALVAAGLAIAEGRPQAALGLVAEATTWHADADTAEVEAAARNALGLKLATSNDLDGAIAAMEAAILLGGAAHPALGGLYLTRARQRFAQALRVGGMSDLRRAVEVDPSITASAAGLAALELAELLGTAEPLAREDHVAILVAGDWARGRTEHAVAEELRTGEASLLDAVVSVADDERVDAADADWARSLLAQHLERTGAALDALLEPGRLDATLRDEHPWSEAGAPARSELRATCQAWVALRALSLRATGVGAAPPDASDLQTAMREGVDPRALEDRDQQVAQLLAVWSEVDRLLLVADNDPARLGAALAHGDRFPVDAVEHARLALGVRALRPSGAYAIATEDGPAMLRATWEDGGLKVLVALDGPAVTDASIGQYLRVLFGLARPVLGAHVAATHVELRVETVAGSPSPALRARLSRVDVERMNWTLVAAEAPFGPAHLSLVLDHERAEGVGDVH